MFNKINQLDLYINEAKENIEDVISFLEISDMVLTDEHISMLEECRVIIDKAQEITCSIIEELDTDSTDMNKSLKTAFKEAMPETDIEACRLNIQRIENALNITGNVLTSQYLDYLSDIQLSLNDLSAFVNDCFIKLHSESVKPSDIFKGLHPHHPSPSN